MGVLGGIWQDSLLAMTPLPAVDHCHCSLPICINLYNYFLDNLRILQYNYC